MCAVYRFAGQEISFSNPISELAASALINAANWADDQINPNLLVVPTTPSCQTVGWVGGGNRQVETRLAPPGILLKVEGGSDFCITSGGQAILKVDATQRSVVGGGGESSLLLSALDREILLGPALVLALAMRGTWSLHASAVMFRGKTIAFLGESGQGKSTLAAYLSSSNKSSGWRLVADDILPVTASSTGVVAWPRFPQLKLPVEAQPGISLPEQIPLNALCVLVSAAQDESPDLQLLPPNLAARGLISHTAGTRLFMPELLGKHLEFCTRVAAQIPVYRLIYPHSRDGLPTVKRLLESLC
jgi:hypothetical protein